MPKSKDEIDGYVSEIESKDFYLSNHGKNLHDAQKNKHNFQNMIEYVKFLINNSVEADKSMYKKMYDNNKPVQPSEIPPYIKGNLSTQQEYEQDTSEEQNEHSSKITDETKSRIKYYKYKYKYLKNKN